MAAGGLVRTWGPVAVSAPEGAVEKEGAVEGDGVGGGGPGVALIAGGGRSIICMGLSNISYVIHGAHLPAVTLHDSRQLIVIV